MDRKKVINAFYLYVNKKICVFGPQDSSKWVKSKVDGSND